MRIVDQFQITGRGVVVVLDEATHWRAGSSLEAKIYRPDGTVISAIAEKEWLLRNASKRDEVEAFLLRGLSHSDVPNGSEVRLLPMEV